MTSDNLKEWTYQGKLLHEDFPDDFKCPKCGGDLVEKKTKRGTKEYLYNENGQLIQKSFLGSDGKKSFC